ncbi:hypothetical protein CUJ89_33855 [Burkholderia pyrrocinia]|uniref:Calcium-mediated lectin domain-containing protein n=1 Tax=Burkholderia pyrrocinia TaxID=60550 RepID=A0A2Z5N8Y6_BURPY|nr:hypothetical protein CUJ89_33855 [Burkholderia pyrrocinia]
MGSGRTGKLAIAGGLFPALAEIDRPIAARLGRLGADDGADSDYNDGIVILQWPIT